jgi:MarC family membrane protein
MTAMPIAEIFSAAVLLLLVIDPFGNVPIVIAALANVRSERRIRVVLRECAAAYVILLVFMLGGRTFLKWMQLSEVSLAIAGGIILFLIALRMVFHHPEGVFGDPPGAEPFVVPLAIPAIAGPSALATVMLMVSRDPSHRLAWIVALTIAMAITTLVLLAAYRLQRALGERGMIAVERLMGLVLTAIAVQMLLDGVQAYVVGLGHGG